MKRLILFLLMSLTANSLFAEGRIDTLYYTKDWRYAPNETFADFYRIAYSSEDGHQSNQFRDYYITGELQGSGSFIKIDPNDDRNSIFDGECVSYYKSGKQRAVAHYSGGVLDGEFCLYAESGLIQEYGKYADGELDGLHTEFLDNGLFVQVEYSAGTPIHDYYVMGDEEGHISKFRLCDNTPYWESPELWERVMEYNNDEPWQVYNKNGLMVALTNSTVRDYGKWHRIDIVISNNSLSTIEFDPKQNITASSIDSDNIVTDLEVWSSEEYIKKVNRTQILTAALMGLAEGLSTASAGYSSSVTTTTHRSGHHSSISVSHTRTYSASDAIISGAFAMQRMANLTNLMSDEQHIKKLGYIKKNTINPGESISGYVLIKRVRGYAVKYVVNIEGAEYIFNWDFGKQRK